MSNNVKGFKNYTKYQISIEISIYFNKFNTTTVSKGGRSLDQKSVPLGLSSLYPTYYCVEYTYKYFYKKYI